MTVRFFYSAKLSMGRNGRRNVYVEVENARGSGVPFTWQSEALTDQAAQDDLEAALAHSALARPDRYSVYAGAYR